MTTRLRRAILFLGTAILMMQSVSISGSMVSADTSMDTEEHELVELLSVQNSLEELFSDPHFFFPQSQLQGKVEEPLQVTFFSDQEVSEARITLPEEATISKEKLSAGISLKKGENPTEWLVQSKQAQNKFVLPVTFESEGTFDVSIADESVTIDIQEKEADSEASDHDNELPEEVIINPREMDIGETGKEELASFNTINVSTWGQFRTAINNQNVTTINVLANISGNTSFNPISRDLTINGNGHTINSQGQQYVVNRRSTVITVRNATLSTNIQSFDQPLFLYERNVGGATFIFSDIDYRGNTFLVGSDNFLVQDIIFDGGSSFFQGNRNTASVFVQSKISLTNNASVNVIDRTFARTYSNTPSTLANEISLSIDESSELFIDGMDSTITIQMLTVEGKLVVNNSNVSIFGQASSVHTNNPFKLLLGSNSEVILNRNGSYGSLFGRYDVGTEISIAKGAQFDFINHTGGRILSDGITNNTILQSDQLAFWDLGLQDEEQASMVFTDIELSLSGHNGSIIESTNNERFARLYDSTGLAAYSRMSNRSVEEMTRTVIAKYLDTEGNEIIEPEVITGLLGDNYQTKGKIIPGYQLVENPSNESGEFSRETIEVSYIYETANVTPVDPLDPEIEIDPENKPELPEDQGLLSIDFASTFNFGTQAISIHDQTYYAQSQRLLNEDGTVKETEERPNYVQISDRRPESERNGWELAVTQKEQFKGEENQVLNGASISLSNQQVVSAQGGTAPGLQSVPCELIPGNRRTLLKAQGNEGVGTWIYRFGDAETAKESVALNVPKGANPEAISYSTTLTWELSAVPDN